MGISKGSIRLLLRSFRNRTISGKVLTYGKHGVDAQYQDLVSIFQAENYPFRKLEQHEIVLDPLTQFGNTVHQDVLFKMCGFEEVHSVDYFKDENPTFILDLNRKLPGDMREKYNFVFDGGTMEHCFDVKQVLCNVVNFVKLGGYVCHLVPMAGMIDHGFFSFSPTLFLDFYSENGFSDIQIKILDGPYYPGRTMRCFQYNERLNEVINQVVRKHGIIFFTAKKAKRVDEIKVPIQKYYKKIHSFGKKATEQSTNKFKAITNVIKKLLGKRLTEFIYYQIKLRLRVRLLIWTADHL